MFRLHAKEKRGMDMSAHKHKHGKMTEEEEAVWNVRQMSIAARRAKLEKVLAQELYNGFVRQFSTQAKSFTDRLTDSQVMEVALEMAADNKQGAAMLIKPILEAQDRKPPQAPTEAQKEARAELAAQAHASVTVQQEPAIIVKPQKGEPPPPAPDAPPKEEPK